MGAVGRAVDDPALATTLAGLPLRNPVGLAAGFDKTCAHLGPLAELGFGYVVGGTITRVPRAGNPKPRIVRYPARALDDERDGPAQPRCAASCGVARPWRSHRRLRFVSIADEAVEDALEAFALLEPLADGVELNASCPNVSWGRDRDNEAHLA